MRASSTPSEGSLDPSLVSPGRGPLAPSLPLQTAPVPASVPRSAQKRPRTKPERPSYRYAASAAKLSSVEEFDPTTAFTDFGGDLRRFAWREMAAARQPSDHCDITLRRREALAASGDSDFATAMATALSRRAHQPIVRGQLQLLNEDRDGTTRCEQERRGAGVGTRAGRSPH